MRPREGKSMRIRHFVIATALSVSLLPSAAWASAASDAMTYCKADYERLCPGVSMGGGRIVACLKAHKMEVSVGCAKALQKIKADMGK